MRKHFFLLIALLVISSSFHFSAATLRPTEPDPITVKIALEEFKNLSRKEMKSRFKEVKKEIRAYKAAKKAGKKATDTNTVLLVILAILIPPLAVYLHQGSATSKFWITLLLTILAVIGAFALGWYLWFVAVIYALLVILGVA